jgi:GT2 family glycosyltransferase/lipopolysaccharide/colanic/teichoic acid biosynthesis glycosyltransferase
MDLSVIIVNYNVRDFLESALTSVMQALKGIDGEVIVVDNASDDGSVDMVRRKFPSVRTIANDTNIGFAAANNIALRQSAGRILLLLNPDTVVQEDTFQTIMRFMDTHPDAGMAGCRILNPDGTLQPACRRSFPTPWVAFTKISGLSALYPESRIFGKYNLGYLDPDSTYEVDAISGSFMAVRREAYGQAGGLDEEYFMYGEDLDWCYRVKKAGWKVYYVSETRIIHYKGESVRRSDIDEVKHFHQAMRVFVAKNTPGGFLAGMILRAGITVRQWLAFFSKSARPARAAIGDLLLMAVAWLSAEYLWFGEVFRFPGYAYPVSFLVPWMVVASAMYIMGAYTVRKHSLATVAGAVAAGYVFISALTFFFKDYAFSRMVVLISGSLNVLFLTGWRALARRIFGSGQFARRSLFGRPALIVGADQSGREVARRLRANPQGGYDVVGFIDTTNRRIGEKFDGVEILGSIDNIGKIILQEKVSEVIFSTDALSYKDILSVIAKTKHRSVNFRLVPNSLEVIIGKTHIDRLNDLPFVQIEYGLNRLSNRFFKRTLDIVGGCALYAVLRPFSGLFAGSHLRRRLGNLPAVLRGQMSLVGPTGNGDNGGAPGGREAYLGKRGLTSLADLNTKDDLTAEERERYDVYYAKNQTIILDLEILMRSLKMKK